MGQTAIAITDHGVLYGAIDFYSTARAAKINPISAARCTWRRAHATDREGRADRDPNHLILLARNDVGYRNLIKLVSASHLEGYYYKPRIDRELLAEHAEGLICLSACLGGELPQAIVRGDMAAAETIAREHAEIFGHGQLLPRAPGPRHPGGGRGSRGPRRDRPAHRPAACRHQRLALHQARGRRGARHPALPADRQLVARTRSASVCPARTTTSRARSRCASASPRTARPCPTRGDRGSVSRRDSAGAQPAAHVLADPGGSRRRHLPAASCARWVCRSATATRSTTRCASA